MHAFELSPQKPALPGQCGYVLPAEYRDQEILALPMRCMWPASTRTALMCPDHAHHAGVLCDPCYNGDHTRCDGHRIMKRDLPCACDGPEHWHPNRPLKGGA